MSKKKTVHSELDIKATLYIVDFIKEEYFFKVSNIGEEQIDEICIKINEQTKESISKSTIKRLLDFRLKPHPLNYNTLDKIVQWCFSEKRTTYKDFLEKEQSNINRVIKISNDEMKLILKALEKKSKPVVKKEKINFSLGEIPVSFTLGEGFVEKLINEVTIITGDLLTDKIKNAPKEFGIVSKQSINTRLALQEIRRDRNINNIIATAIEFARKQEALGDFIDPDWVVNFFNTAQDCSNKKMQYLWAKLLANEVRSPGSISRRTIAIVQLMEPMEAIVFTKLCSCIWSYDDTTGFKESILIYDTYREEAYSDETWGFDSLLIPHLITIGLVADSFIDLMPNKTYSISFFGNQHQIQSSEELDQLHIVTLTREGKQLFELIKASPNLNYYEATIDYFKNTNILR